MSKPSHALAAPAPLHPKLIQTQHYITSQNNLTLWQHSANGEVIFTGKKATPPSSLVVFGKRKPVYKKEDGIDNFRSKRPKHYSPLENSRVLTKTYPDNFQSGRLQDAGEITADKTQQQETTQPFLNVLAKLGKKGAPLLAQEIKQLNVSGFPMDAVADKLANKMIRDQKTGQSNPDTAVDSSIDVAVTVRSLLSDLRRSITNPSSDIMEKLEDFDEVSQSFGLKNAVNHLDFLDQCISCVCSKLSKKPEKSS